MPALTSNCSGESGVGGGTGGGGTATGSSPRTAASSSSSPSASTAAGWAARWCSVGVVPSASRPVRASLGSSGRGPDAASTVLGECRQGPGAHRADHARSRRASARLSGRRAASRRPRTGGVQLRDEPSDRRGVDVCADLRRSQTGAENAVEVRTAGQHLPHPVGRALRRQLIRCPLRLLVGWCASRRRWPLGVPASRSHPLGRSGSVEQVHAVEVRVAVPLLVLGCRRVIGQVGVDAEPSPRQPAQRHRSAVSAEDQRVDADDVVGVPSTGVGIGGRSRTVPPAGRGRAPCRSG